MAETETRPTAGQRWGSIWLPALAVVIVGAALHFGWVDVEPKADPTNAACQTGDKLSELVGRYPEREAVAHLERWRACGQGLSQKAEDKLGRDFGLIAVIGIGLGWSVLVLSRRQRWRRAGQVGLLLALIYVVADVWENALLYGVLSSGRPAEELPWIAGMKMGAVLGAIPVVITAILLKVSGARKDRSWLFDGGGGVRGARREDRENVEPKARVPAAATAPVGGVPEVTTGVACSGGGVRSAAFTLGALQALDEAPAPLKDPPVESELATCGVIASVSGGSYMAAAWVTARGQTAPPGGWQEPPWSRRSPEEDYLRRNSSYLAPGIAGKAWALVWFFLGLVLNVGLIVLTLGAISLPFGWAIDALQDVQTPRGEIALPAGGCIQSPNGSWIVASSGTKLKLAGDSEPQVAPGGAVVEPQKKGDEKASAEAEGSPAIAIAVAGGLQTTTTTTSAPAQGSSPCRPADPTATSSGVRPSAPGRVFSKGTQVPVVAGAGLVAHGSSVSGCRPPNATSPPSTACDPAKVTVEDVAEGSRVMSAPTATLMLTTAAIVDEQGQLLRACNSKECESFRRPGWLSVPLWLLLSLFMALGIAMVAVPAYDEGHREGRQERVKILAAVSAGAVLLLVVLPWAVTLVEHGRYLLEEKLGLASGASSGTILLALLAQVRSGSGRPTEDTKPGAPKALAQRLGGTLRKLLVRLAAWVAGPVLLVAIALAFAAWGATGGAEPGQVLVLLVMLGFLLIIGSGVDLNEWSLHPYYRDRLQEAYGTRVRDANGTTRTKLDDRLSELSAPPELVLCAAANLADPSITAPGRPVIPWTFTRDCIGSMEIEAVAGHGTYAPSDLVDHRLNSVWTAVAVSGAAFSPGMGKMTRPERCLLAVGNLRLGVWYPNPIYFGAEGKRGSKWYDREWYRRHHPRPWYLAKEAFGRHKLRDPWIYVTDGGHYENLGLVELIRRGCREIYCFDASGDSPDTFGTLADAMRLAREELDVEIMMDPTAMKPDSSGVSRMGVWAGTIVYPGSSDVGWFVLAKLAVPRTAPFDVVDLARTLPSFPNHPTADQLYTDQKFEAYRALGHHLGAEAAMVGRSIRRFTDLPEQWSVAAAVKEVNSRLCARPDPASCPPKEPAKSEKDKKRGD